MQAPEGETGWCNQVSQPATAAGGICTPDPASWQPLPGPSPACPAEGTRNYTCKDSKVDKPWTLVSAAVASAAAHEGRADQAVPPADPMHERRFRPPPQRAFVLPRMQANISTIWSADGEEYDGCVHAAELGRMHALPVLCGECSFVAPRLSVERHPARPPFLFFQPHLLYTGWNGRL